jgi:hypothetical protein
MTTKAQPPGDGAPDFMTPMLFQYVVALCCARRNPDAVDITIGDYVVDATTQAARDVDVTVTLTEADGSRRAFKGYEVKREKAPLDVVDVEQLCMKFIDLPDVTHRAIVSASGYTANAVKKAKAHGVELYERKEWVRPVRELIPELANMGVPAEAFKVRTYGLVWAGEGTHYLEAPAGTPEFQWTSDRALYSGDGTPHGAYADVGQYLDALRRRALDYLWALPEIESHVTPELVAQVEAQGAVDTPPWAHTHIFGVEMDGVYLKFEPEVLVQIVAVHINGQLQWQMRKRLPQFFVLENVDTHEVYAGTAISQATQEDVYMGFVFAPGSRNITFHTRIALTERQQKVIRRLKLLATPGTAAEKV